MKFPTIILAAFQLALSPGMFGQEKIQRTYHPSVNSGKKDAPKSNAVIGGSEVIVPAKSGLTDRESRPKTISNFAVVDMTPFRTISEKDFTASASTSKLILADVIRLEKGFTSNSTQLGPSQMILIADTISIKGRVLLDLSKNKLNQNGYLGLICRTLQVSEDALLMVRLASEGQELYRRFFVITEGLLLNNKKVFEETRVIKEKIQSYNGDFKNKPNIYIRKQIAGHRLGVNINAWNPYNIVNGVGIIENISEVLRPLPEFSSCFSRWVVAMHDKIYGEMLVSEQVDKYEFANKYLRFKTMSAYQVPGSFAQRLNSTRAKINTLVHRNLGVNNTFIHGRVINDKTYQIVSLIEGHTIKNILLPDRCRVELAAIDSVPHLGYLLFDENDYQEFALEFDIKLENDRIILDTIKEQLAKQNILLDPFSGQITFDHLFLEGNDLIGNKCKLTQLSSNRYKVHMVTRPGSSLLFYKLFTGVNTDIQIRGQFQQIHTNIPLVMSRVSSTTLSGQAHAQNLDLILNPDRYGDYFEQIDGSDALVQSLFVFNSISALPKDSISGNLNFVEVHCNYDDGTLQVHKSMNLSSAGTKGDKGQLQILRKKKEYVTVTIQGIAHYENGVYKFGPMATKEGESSIHLTDKMLINGKN